MTAAAVTRRRLTADRGGAVALEFALVGTCFLAMLTFVFYIGFTLYAQVALDDAAAEAARLLAVDSKQQLSGSVQKFQSLTFCPLLTVFIGCANIALSLQPVTDYLNDAQATPPIAGQNNPFSPGQGSSLMLLQASYTLPLFGWRKPGGGAAGSRAARGGVLTASYPYINEY